jgi:undecaprenyl pyrophosphate phosphatase UppP
MPDDVNEFSFYLILPAALGPGVYSARKEYQKQENNVSGE